MEMIWWSKWDFPEGNRLFPLEGEKGQFFSYFPFLLLLGVKGY